MIYVAIHVLRNTGSQTLIKGYPIKNKLVYRYVWFHACLDLEGVLVGPDLNLHSQITENMPPSLPANLNIPRTHIDPP